MTRETLIRTCPVCERPMWQKHAETCSGPPVQPVERTCECPPGWKHLPDCVHVTGDEAA